MGFHEFFTKTKIFPEYRYHPNKTVLTLNLCIIPRWRGCNLCEQADGIIARQAPRFTWKSKQSVDPPKYKQIHLAKNMYLPTKNHI